MNEIKETTYVFEIETDKYAGNFEREMCAYVTGIVGECEVGKKYVDENIEDKFEDMVKQVPDEHACYRPCACDGNTVQIFFEYLPLAGIMSLLKERVKEFADMKQLIIKSYAIKEKTVTEKWNVISHLVDGI